MKQTAAQSGRDTQQAPKCDVIVANNDEVLLIADDPEGFDERARLQVSSGGVVTALRNRRFVVVARIPEPIATFASRRREIVFRCVRTGTTRILTYPSQRP